VKAIFMKDKSIFHRIASALTVIEIAEPIQYIYEAGTPLESAHEDILEGDGSPCVALVTEHGAPKGFLEWPSSFAADKMKLNVERVATKIEVWRLVSAETSLLDLIPMWHRSYYFLFSMARV
jgi:hypothetical protein